MLVLSKICTPLNLIFLSILIGHFVGKIKLGYASVGIAGILFTAIGLGAIVSHSELLRDDIYMASFQNEASAIAAWGSNLFIPIVGIHAGLSLTSNNKTNVYAGLIGACMSLAGVGTMLAIDCMNLGVSRSMLLGILCGALTSTPGLSAVCENLGTASEEAIWGYGSSYLFGVIIVVWLVSVVVTKKEITTCHQPKQTGIRLSVFPELLVVSIVAFVGNIVGIIKVPALGLTLGATGGMLCVGIVMGYIIQSERLRLSISTDTFHIIRAFGLLMFLGGTGLRAGIRMTYIQPMIIFVGLAITIVAIISGYILSKIVRHYTDLDSACIIAGGMTSSPALGTLTNKNAELCMDQYSFAYFGAMISLMLCIQFIL